MGWSSENKKKLLNTFIILLPYMVTYAKAFSGEDLTYASAKFEFFTFLNIYLTFRIRIILIFKNSIL